MVKALTISALRLCRAASAIQMAVSAVPATTATGGVAPRAVPTTPATVACTTTTRVSITTTTISLACEVFVVSMTRRVVLAKQTHCAAASEASGMFGKNLRQWWCEPCRNCVPKFWQDKQAGRRMVYENTKPVKINLWRGNRCLAVILTISLSFIFLYKHFEICLCNVYVSDIFMIAVCGLYIIISIFLIFKISKSSINLERGRYLKKHNLKSFLRYAIDTDRYTKEEAEKKFGEIYKEMNDEILCEKSGEISLTDTW